MEILVLCLIFGALAGLIAGLFGLGGGVVLVPFLMWLFNREGFSYDTLMVTAVATSLATIIPTSISSIFAHHKRDAVIWRIVFRMVPGILVGSVFGSIIADKLPTTILKTVFGIYLLLVSVQMFLQAAPKAQNLTLSNPVASSAGSAIGVLSSLLGIGGGSLTVPFLFKCQFPMRNAVAISSACGLPIAVAGTVSYMLLGWNVEDASEWSMGYVYLPAFGGIVASSIFLAPVGAKMAHSLPTEKLKRFFAVFLFFVGIKILWW